MSRSTISRFGFPAQEGRASVIFLKRIFFVCLLLSISAGCVTTTGGGGTVRFDKLNAYEVALSPFYLASHTAIDTDHAWHMTLTVSSGMPIAGFLKPNQMLMESFTRWIYSLNPSPGKVLNVSGERAIDGACEGSYSGQIQMSTGGRFTGELTFSEFADDCSLVLGGEVPFEGSLDLTSGLMSAELSMPPLVAKLAEEEITLKGDLQLKFNAFKGEKQASSGTSDMVLSDSDGVRFELEDMEFSWDHNGDFQKLSVNGLIDFANMGSVNLVTTSPLIISNTPGRLVTAYKSEGTPGAGEPAQASHKRRLPFSGALLFHGADDGWVRLLFGKSTYPDPGFFWIDTSGNMQSMGTL